LAPPYLPLLLQLMLVPQMLLPSPLAVHLQWKWAGSQFPVPRMAPIAIVAVIIIACEMHFKCDSSRKTDRIGTERSETVRFGPVRLPKKLVDNSATMKINK